MIMNYELYGRCMWHTDCKEWMRGSGIFMRVKDEPDKTFYRCLHCGKMGYYPVGGLGCVEVEEVPTCPYFVKGEGDECAKAGKCACDKGKA